MLRDTGTNQVWSWDIANLHTTVQGACLYYCLVIDVWSHEVVAWDVDKHEDPTIIADLVSGAYLREKFSERRKQTLIYRADNRNAMRAATLERHLEGLGVIRLFSRLPPPRVSNEDQYSGALFRTVKYHPDYPRPFGGRPAKCRKFLGSAPA